MSEANEASPATVGSEVERVVRCAWCARPGAAFRPLMSKEHPVCRVCYMIWYDYAPTPKELVEMSLGEIGKQLEASNDLIRGASHEP